MAVFTWTGQDTAAGTQTIGATDKMSFFGSAFGDAITITEYQDSTHVENSSKDEQCTVNHIHNTKYLTSGTVSLDGGGSISLSTVTTAQCPLKINFSDASSVATTNCIFWIYGASESADPTDITVQGAEQGDAAWTACGGAGTDVTIADDTAATSHDYYIIVSVSPDTIGEKNTEFTMKIQLTYQ